MKAFESRINYSFFFSLKNNEDRGLQCHMQECYKGVNPTLPKMLSPITKPIDEAIHFVSCSKQCLSLTFLLVGHAINKNLETTPSI